MKMSDQRKIKRLSMVEAALYAAGRPVDIESLKGKNVEITHINLNDNTLEGFRHREHSIFTAQYHPEASPGPRDAEPLFIEFMQTVVAHYHNRNNSV